MATTDNPIVAIDFVTETGLINITRKNSAEHGMYSTRQHAIDLAALHKVPLTIDDEPAE